MKKSFLPLLSVLLILSCNKKEARFPEGWNSVTYGPDFQSLFVPLQPHEQEFLINADTEDSFVTAEGIRFKFRPNSFRELNGTPANGVVKLYASAFFRNADLLTGNLTTSLLNGIVLANAGSFGVKATGNGGRTLAISNPVRISLPDNNIFNNRFSVYRGMPVIPIATNDISRSVLMLWEQDSISWTKGEYQSHATYDFNIYSLNFWGLLRNAYPMQPATTVEVKLPGGYGNTNCAVFAFLPESGMIRLKGDLSTTLFTTGDNKLPTGIPVKILSLANIGERLGYNLQTVTLTGQQQIVVEEMKQITARDLSEIIKNDLN